MIVAAEKNMCTKKNFDFRVESCAQPRIISDHLGSTRVVLKEDGSVDGFFDYYPNGKVSRSSETINSPAERLTGKQHDGESNLEYFGARYYNADVVRWLSVDPLSEKHRDWTPYNYVLGNPLILIDPDGRQVDFNRVSTPSATTINLFREASTYFSNTLSGSAGLEGGVTIAKGEGRVGPAKLGFEVDYVSVAGGVNEKGNSVFEWKFITAKGEGAFGSATGKIEGNVVKEKYEFQDGNVTKESKELSGEAKGTLGKNGFELSADKSFKVEVGGKTGALKAKVGIDFYQAYKGFEKAAEGASQYVKDIINTKGENKQE
ncbi:RHS repeat-associated core domain-containing protein [bacterium]|nr:RHS repeat-associated core domain-containing protein [bacterium]